MRKSSLFGVVLAASLSCGPGQVDGLGEASDDAALGTANGLSGAYYRGTSFGNLVTTRVDSQVSFNWDKGAPMNGLSADNFSVRWTGQVLAPVSGKYTFTTTSDDGVRLTVGGQKLVDDWTTHASKDDSGALQLTAGKKYDVTMEYFEGTGRAVAQLSWAYPGQARQVIPSAQLFSSAATQPPPSEPMNIYYGSTHDHTGNANNHGEGDKASAETVFADAKANGFDFLYLTEHSGSTGPSSMGFVPAQFYAQVKQLVAKYTDDKFVGVAGFEFSDNDGGGGLGKGHMTAANTDDFVSADGQASNSGTLEDYLAAQAAAGRPAYGGFNHPAASGHPGSVTSLLTPAHRNVIVMNEVHNSYLDTNADAEHYQSFVAALDRGWRVAPTCGLDGHGDYRVSDKRTRGGPCRVGALMPSLTKANLDAAFMARRIFSTRNINLRVSYQANGQWMGSQIGKPSSVAFDIEVSDPDTTTASDKITRIDIITEGGAVAATKSFDTYDAKWQVSLPSNGKKYFFLRIFNAERTTYTAAAAPVWLE